MRKRKDTINRESGNTRPRRASAKQPTGTLPDSTPISRADLQALFDHLTRDGVPECDHTLRETQAFFKNPTFNPEPVISWLKQHDGHCDCEVRLNVMLEFGEELEKLEQYVSSQLPGGGEVGEGTVGNATAPSGIPSNQEPATAENKETRTENASSAAAHRPQGTRRAHSQIPASHDVKVMEQVAKQLEWAIARDKSKLRICREMICKAKKAG